ncbi:MAG TPA: autotransporter outer membrane beta-barrel domain-containing protein [Dyella sp.]|uniref:autotransporter family protein n=1 Tax=Dyella sp. TaxID=1869338 RepID=UPI002F94568D
MSMHPKKFQNKALTLSIAVALASASPMAFAATLNPGQTATINPATPVEGWILNSATLNVLPGGRTQNIDARTGSAVNVFGGQTGEIVAIGGTIVNIQDSQTNIVRLNDSNATIAGATITDQRLGIGLSVNAGLGQTSTATVSNSSITSHGRGANTVGDSTLTLSGSTVHGIDDGKFASGLGLGMFGGTVLINDSSTVTGDVRGILMGADYLSTTKDMSLVIDGATVIGKTGTAIEVSEGFDGPSVANITVTNGANLVSGNGILLDVNANGSSLGSMVDFNVSQSSLTGDIVADAASTVNVNLDNAASLTGKMTHAGDVTVSGGAQWMLTADSDVGSMTLNNGTVAFQPQADGTHGTLQVRGDFAGNGGGTIRLNTVANTGGTLDNQFTDRVLIAGDVTNTGTTFIEVVSTGEGNLTDVNKDGIVDAKEGISLVQVGGNSRADAFAVKGGYVAAGPWQYTLHAFGPGEADQSQSLLPGGTTWDYRLANKFVTEEGPIKDDPIEEGPNPVAPEPEQPVTGPERPAVVPQVPSYLVAPTALFAYGDQVTDGLMQRLGDIRSTQASSLGGEVFARYTNTQQRYTSDRNFQDFGYGFKQQINAMQLGGGLVSLVDDNATWRAGWALDHGTTRVTPKAVDGQSSARYTANGASAWLTWQHNSGWYIDAVVGGRRYSGTVDTAARGDQVARLRASGWVASVETGYPFALGAGWTLEPQLQVKHQTLNFNRTQDIDGLNVALGSARQTTTRLGAQLSKTIDPRFAPYVRLDLSHTSGGRATAAISNDAWNMANDFGVGRLGNSYRVGAGATSQLGRNVQIFGEGTYQHQLGHYGMRGWGANVGVRVNF